MIKYKEVKSFIPTEEERNRILSRFNNSKKAGNRLKVFAVLEDVI